MHSSIFAVVLTAVSYAMAIPTLESRGTCAILPLCGFSGQAFASDQPVDIQASIPFVNCADVCPGTTCTTLNSPEVGLTIPVPGLGVVQFNGELLVSLFNSSRGTLLLT